MARVLITAAGGDIGIGAIQSLQKTSHSTTAVDMDPYAAGLYFADHGTTVPPAGSDEWPTAMAQVVDEYNIDVIIPLLDQELQELDRLRSLLSEDTPIIVPRDRLIKKTIDKKEMYDYFTQHGLRVPKTVIGNKSDKLLEHPHNEFPKIVKPRYGQGGQGVKLLHTPNEFQEYLHEFGTNPSDFVIQDFINGPEYTSNVTVTKDNRLLSIVTKEVPERDGYTALGITRDNPVVRNACLEVFEALNPAGPINVQHILDDEGTPYLIEINPRFSGSSCLNVKAGVNEFDLLIRDILDDNVEPVDGYEKNLSIIRYTDQIYIAEKNLFSCYNE